MEFQYGSFADRRRAAAASGVGSDRSHVGSHGGIRFDRRRPFEIGAGDLAELDREFQRLQTCKALREMVDGVVLHRERAVAAGVGHLEAKVLIHLLGRLDLVGQVLPVAHVAAAALVDRELGVDEIPVLADQPLGAVELTALLVCGEREDQIAFRLEPFPLQANQVGDELRGHGLVVARAAAVEPSVLLAEDERIERPVLALRIDDIEMRKQQHRALCAGSAVPRDEVELVGRRAEQQDVGIREAGGPEPRGHCFGSLGHAAGWCVGCVDFDELFVDVPRVLFVRRGLGEHSGGGDGGTHEGKSKRAHAETIAHGRGDIWILERLHPPRSW